MKTLFDAERHSLQDALELTADSLRAHGAGYRHWCLAYSGGKDSTATLASTVYLIETGQVPRPLTLTTFYADTRQELPPLHANALATLDRLRQRGYGAEVVTPDLDDRFFVYMFGRGVPPPTNRFRWCTDQLKIEPMNRAIRRLAERLGERPLLLIGLRLGESAARDGRIALACGRDGGECGQGWFQVRPPSDAADTLSPCLHWRTCHVWDWLRFGLPDDHEANPHPPKSPEWRDHIRRHAMRLPCHGFDTRLVAEVYSQDVEGSANEVAARTGCVGCPLASQDTSLQRVLRLPQWSHLAPLRRLHPLYRELRHHRNRLRKGNDERRKDGSLVSNPGRIGPLTMEARRFGLDVVLGVQREINAEALRLARPSIDLLNAEEEARIRELQSLNTWPERWDGTELPGDTPLPDVHADGSMQHLLWEGLQS